MSSHAVRPDGAELDVPLDKALLLEPAPALMQQFQLSLDGVQSLWHRIATAHSPLLTGIAGDMSTAASVMPVAQLLASGAATCRARIPTSLPTLDAALGGGLPSGQLVELTAAGAGVGSARRLAQRWACNALRTTADDDGAAHDTQDDGTVYWLTAATGPAGVDVCMPIARAVEHGPRGSALSQSLSSLFPVPVTDVTMLEADVLPALQTRCAARLREMANRSGPRGAGRCLVVLDDVTTLVRRSFPGLYDTGSGERDEVFAMHAVLQRLTEKLKVFADQCGAVCVLITELPVHNVSHASAAVMDGAPQSEDSILGRAFAHAMNLRIAARDGIWCVQPRAPPSPSSPSPSLRGVGLRTELRLVKSAVCGPLTLLAHVVDDDRLTVAEVDALVPVTSAVLAPRPGTLAPTIAVDGVSTHAALLVPEAFLESLDGWDHTARPRFVSVEY